MTLLPSPLAQSTLSEKAALYLDHVTDNIPEFLHTLRPRLDPWLTYSVTHFRSVAQALPFDADEQTTAICAALLVCVLTIAAMSWGNPLSNLWRRSTPQVTEGSDFSYITPDYIVDPPANNNPRPNNQYRYEENVDENEPDTISLRHRGTFYPLRFRAYAIDDGLLTVGALREEAARQTGAANPNQVRLLYKGNLLKDDHRSCKAEGLKQHSEVLCVVSEVGASTPSEVSDSSDPRRPGSSSSRVDGDDGEGVGSSSDKGKKKKNKKKSKSKKKTPLEPTQPAPSGSSSHPPLPPNLKLLPGKLKQIAALHGYLGQVLIPMCDEYVSDPPAEEKKREFEYRKLSETILAQIMLKADGIEPDGDADIRNARKALIREAQANLNRLDQVNRA